MDYSVKSNNPAKQKTACLLLPVYRSRRLSQTAEELNAAADGRLAKIVKRSALSGARGQTLLLFDVPQAAAERVLLVGCGDRDKPLAPHQFVDIAGAAAAALADSGAGEALSCLTQVDVEDRDAAWKLRQLVAAHDARAYRFDRLKSGGDDGGDKTPPLKKVAFHVASGGGLKAAAETVSQAAAIASGVALAKDLGNLPGNVCTPSYLADQAKTLNKKYKTLKVKVLNEAEMKKLGMGSLLSVSAGSAEAAKLIVIEHRKGPRKQAPYVLLGKGITFDTGGISLKPGAAMDEMKFDMCGAASVLGTMRACAELDLPINAIGVIAAAENMPDGRATKPGDIVTSMSGQTIEILNTDAEGRLVLCDALTYCERFEPAAVIDIATLTGACVIALGKHPHGLFSNHQPLADALAAAGERAHDRPWQMPLWPEYQSQLDSNFADMANVGGREAGSVTAACFLARYAEKFHWAHLDIAGTAWLGGKSKGGTGRPVPLLTQYLIDRAADKS